MVDLILPAKGDPGYEEGGTWAEKVLAAFAALNDGKPDIDRLAEYLPPLALAGSTPVESEAEMLALTAMKGDIAVRTDIGSAFILIAEPATTLANWTPFSAPGEVVSVAGKTGAVTLTRGDVGLGNVDDTSDNAKPVSALQREAIDERVRYRGAWASGTAYRAGDWVHQPVTGQMFALRVATHTASGSAPTATTSTWLAIPVPVPANPIWTGTQAQYDALATKDPNTLYVVPRPT